MKKSRGTEFYGWAGTILSIDLTERKITKEPLEREMAVKFLGGDGFGARLLYDRLPAGTKGTDPDNVFVLATGPLTGTICPSSGRISAVFKSPQTDLIGATNAGGFFAPELKWAGYDAIVFTGRAESPVWIWIDNDQVEIRDAGHLWGKDTWGTVEAIEQETGDESISTVTIGPAGENLCVQAAPIVNRVRGLGKCGGGAVMGSKNLKAVAVRGSKGTRIHNPEPFEKLCWEYRQSLLDSPFYDMWAHSGTLVTYPTMEENYGVLPTRNYQEGIFPEGKQSLSVETLRETFEDRVSYACYGCPLQCGRFLAVRSGKYKGVKIEGIEFVAQYGFGPMLGVDNWPFVIKAHEVCTLLGLSYGVSSMLAWMSELYQRGLISKDDTDGLDLSWGNEESYLKLLEKIATRDGIGDVLARPYAEAAKIVGKGSETYQAVISRLDTTEDPRGRMDIALSHMISNRGGDHCKALPYFPWFTPPEYTHDMFPDWPKGVVDTYSPEGKVELIDFSEDFHAICDGLGVCMFPTMIATPYGGADKELLARLLTEATGVEYTGESLLEAGRRIAVLERAFNVREGNDRTQYAMSDKFYDTAFPEGIQKGIKADREVVGKMVDDFLVRKGFDPATGFPTKERLNSIGLDDVAEDMSRMGRLAGASLPKDGPE